MDNPDEMSRVLGIRLLKQLLCVAWIWAFFRPIETLGLAIPGSAETVLFAGLFVAAIPPFGFWRVLFTLVSVFLAMGQTVAQALSKHPTLYLRVFDVAHWMRFEIAHLTLWFHTGNIQYPVVESAVLLGLCALFWFVRYASRNTGLWLFYNVLAVAVLGTIDAETTVHPVNSLLMLLIFAVCTQALSYEERLIAGERRAALPPEWNQTIPALLGVLVIAVLAGLLVPRIPRPQGPVIDVTRFPWWPRERHITTEAVSGFPVRNDKLGGSFLFNTTPVLQMMATGPTYLRGRSFLDYTGSGWIDSSNGASKPIAVGPPMLRPSQTFGSSVPVKTVMQNITVLSRELPPGILFGGYVISRLPSMYFIPTHGWAVNNRGDVVGPNIALGATYDVESKQVVQPDLWLPARSIAWVDVERALPRTLSADSLEVPLDFPLRDRALARKIAGSRANSEYTVVKNVIRYLEGNYTYATQGIPNPGPGQDYVDQFLFESKKGYCNNFSSSMAMLLRTLGIPTRWVTGFNLGQEDISAIPGRKGYLLTNADAHSWVEVYFPNVGYIPFDPTPGFQMPYARKASTEFDQNAPTPQPQPVPPTQPNDKPQPQPTSPRHPPQTSSTRIPPWRNLFRVVTWTALVMLVLGVIAVVIAKRRKLALLIKRELWKRDWRRPPTRLLMQKKVEQIISYATRFGPSLGHPVTSNHVTLRGLWPLAEACGIAGDDYVRFVRYTEQVLYTNQPVTADEWKHIATIWMTLAERLQASSKRSPLGQIRNVQSVDEE